VRPVDNRRVFKGDPLEPADLIFVLAGHRTRKIFGALLLAQGWAPGVLMSTGNPQFIARILRAEVTGRLALDAHVWSQMRETAEGPSPRNGLFFAGLNPDGWSVQRIPIGRLGTLSEVRAFASWLAQQHEIRSVLVVSSGLHLTRVRMCCRRLVPNDRSMRYVAVQISNEALLARGERREQESATLVVLEWVKVVVYGLLLPFVKRAQTVTADQKPRQP
jgi:hypothetical protein